MGATPTQQIQALHDRYSQVIGTLPDVVVLTGIIKDCERLLDLGELATHEKALIYRLLGEALLSLGAQGGTEVLERAWAAFLISQQYFQVESNQLAMAAVEVRIAETVATLAMLRRDDWTLMLAAERRACDAAKRVHGLGDFELSAAVVALLTRIDAWQEAQIREVEARLRDQPKDGGEPVQRAAYHLLSPEEVEARAIKDAVQRERLKHLDAAWHASPRSSLADGDSVDCAIFSPPEVPPDSAVLIQAFVYLPDQLQEATRRATAHDAASALRGSTSLDVDVERGSRLCFDLNLPNSTIVEPFQSLRWKGKTSYVTFSAKFAEDAVGSQVGKLLVSLNDIPIGVIRFLITVSRSAPRNLDWIQACPTGRATRYRSAFISYASQDRPEVIRRVQILEALGIKYFQDLLNLDPGQRWEKAIYRAIDDVDLFLLFWSSAARDSSFVRKEIGYAIQLKEGQDEAPPEIIPIVIEGPPAPAPPTELAHLHFSERILYFLPRQKAVVRERWTTCPGCGVRFATYGETWDGRVHKRCGTSLELVDTN